MKDPLSKTHDELQDLVNRISLPDSPVGIDAKYTHAVIIDFLRQIAVRLDTIEQHLEHRE